MNSTTLVEFTPAAERGSRTVSVVIPCFNEENHIGLVLEALLGQWPLERFEIIVVDGNSTDRTTDKVREFAALHKDLKLRVVSNPQRAIPIALNLGIAAASGELIARVDAHSLASSNYVSRCVEVLETTEAAIVGMPWRITPGAETPTARAIALAAAHPFGIGNALYRTGSSAGIVDVDTVPFGVFRKQTWQSLGGFNEQLKTNEDYEFNYRARQRGGRVVLDTSGYCTYFARPTFGALARQYARYGRWKAQMIRQHPRSIRWRQAIAPAFVLTSVALLIASAFSSWAGVCFLGLWATYLACSLLFSARLSRGAGNAALVVLIPIAFLTMHLTWGASCLFGMLFSPPVRESA